MKKLPHGKLCSEKYCRIFAEKMYEYCRYSGAPPCSPVPFILDGEVCYCCCPGSGNAADTPFEAAEDEFVRAQDLAPGTDRILAGRYRAGDEAPSWDSRIVDHSVGIVAGGAEGEPAFDYIYYLAYQAVDEDEPRAIVGTRDQLFLRLSGKVTPIQHLRPGDELVGARGGVSRVTFTVPSHYRGALHQLVFAGFDNETLDGHLLSANGVVTADYSVQLACSTGEINPELLELPAVVNRVPDGGADSRAFVADEGRWPPGLTPRGAPT
ncbi:MAG: hypothetical protein ABIW83_02020 [Allosphingosinicella sp.]